MIIIGLVALFLAFKVVKFLLKLALIILAIVLIASAVHSFL